MKKKASSQFDSKKSNTFLENALRGLFPILILFLLGIEVQAQVLTWNGSVNTEWETSANWDGASVPTVLNDVEIPASAAQQPTINTTLAVAKSVHVQTGAILTITSSGILTINDSRSFSHPVFSTTAFLNMGQVENNGKLILANLSSTGLYGLFNGAKIGGPPGIFNNNAGAEITIDRSDFYTLVNRNSTFNNSGKITIGSDLNAEMDYNGISNYENSTFNNNSGALLIINRYNTGAIYNNAATFSNAGKIVLGSNVSGNNSATAIYNEEAVFNNTACGQMIIENDYIWNIANSVITNTGYISVNHALRNEASFVNNGVLKYGSLTGENAIVSATNSSLIVNDDPTPIFTYGGTYDGTVNGIFTDEAATISAGTFTAPNTFIPSGLPPGSLTLYAKITPAGGSCAFIVPFEYLAPTIITTQPTNKAGCSGSGIFVGVIVEGSGISYQWQVKEGATAFTDILNGAPYNFPNGPNLHISLTTDLDGYQYRCIVSNSVGNTTSSVATITVNLAPTLASSSITHPSTCFGTDGNISFSTNLSDGTYTLRYDAGSSTSSTSVAVSSGAFTLMGLSAEVYSEFVITSNGCSTYDENPKTLIDPIAPTLAAATLVNPTTCAGTDGSIPFTTNLADGTYTLNYNDGGPSIVAVTVNGGAFALENLTEGTYSDFSITNAGCTGTDTSTKEIGLGAQPSLTLVSSVGPNECSGTSGSITFSTTLLDGYYSIFFTTTGTSSPRAVSVLNGELTLSLLSAGNYSNFEIRYLICTANEDSSVALTDPIVLLTAGIAANPTTCGGTDGSISFTTNLADGSHSFSFVSAGTITSKSLTVSNGAFTLTGLSAGSYSAFSITNTNMGCTGTDASTKTLTDPITPTLAIGPTLNPNTCSGTDGKIPFVTNLTDGIYSLSFTTTGTSSPQNVNVSNGEFLLLNLIIGNYSAFSLSNNGCSVINDSLITIVSLADDNIGVNSTLEAICPGESVTFTAGECCETITWTGGPNILTGTSATFSPTINTSYQVHCGTGIPTEIRVNVAKSNVTVSEDISSGNEKLRSTTFLHSAKKIGVPASNPAPYVVFEAGTSIVLGPGFETGASSVFMAEIKICE